MKDLSNSVAIVGVDESDEIGKLPDVSLTSPPPVEETPRALSAPEFHETVSDEEASDD